jgi:DUF1365 family protein
MFVANANKWELNLQRMMVKNSWLMVVIVASERWQGIKTMVKGGLGFVRLSQCDHLLLG